VLSVGTLFQAALLPGLFLAFLYAYAFGFALFRPSSAPPVVVSGGGGEPVTRERGADLVLVAPVGLIGAVILGHHRPRRQPDRDRVGLHRRARAARRCAPTSRNNVPRR
jgi:TRAP-type mannitol/chloroaromatic compound transport system permease large subunit